MNFFESIREKQKPLKKVETDIDFVQAMGGLSINNDEIDENAEPLLGDDKKEDKAVLRACVISVCVCDKVTSDSEAYNSLVKQLENFQKNYFKNDMDFVFFNIASPQTQAVFKFDNQKKVENFDILYKSF